MCWSDVVCYLRILRWFLRFQFWSSAWSMLWISYMCLKRMCIIQSSSQHHTTNPHQPKTAGSSRPPPECVLDYSTCKLSPGNNGSSEWDDFYQAAWVSALDDRPWCQMSRAHTTAVAFNLEKSETLFLLDYSMPSLLYKSKIPSIDYCRQRQNANSTAM